MPVATGRRHAQLLALAVLVLAPLVTGSSHAAATAGRRAMAAALTRGQQQQQQPRAGPAAVEARGLQPAARLRFPSFARLMQASDDKWDAKKNNRETVGTAYSSAQGQDPTGAGDAFTYDYGAEASSTSSYNGVYYNDNAKATLAGDMAKGGWAGAYSKNIPNNIYPNGIASAVATNFDTEMSSQRGPMAISGTYEGARATAGSSSWWNAAQKDSIGGQAIATNIEVYGPTPGKPNLVRKGDDPFGRRSVAFTNNSPNSAAQTGAGNGPAAVASGYEVASAARAARDRKTPPVTLGHREQGTNGVLDSAATGRRLLRQPTAGS